MNRFKEISATELDANAFSLIGKDWTLITAGNLASYNTMTASWGGLGVLWNKNVATIFIRPQRHTYGFVESNDMLTLSFFDEDMRSALAFCGKNSGRDCDKALETGLIPMEAGGSVAFNQAKLVLVCKKIYHQDLDPTNFMDSDIAEHYQNNDYHRMYIAEIKQVLVRE